MNWLEKLIRPEILNLQAYSSARTEYSSASQNQIQLDANENPWPPYTHIDSKLNRYPEPQPLKLRQTMAGLYGVKQNQLLITRGIDEGITLLLQTFCRPYQDSITITPPTFGYYTVAATINATPIIEASLDKVAATDTRIIFLCTPNNPTGTIIPLDKIKTLCKVYDKRAIIAIDEAYIEFADTASATTLLNDCPNLVVMRTLSKAYGLAGARIGALIANPDIIALLSKVMSPYPISTACAEIALRNLSPMGLFYTKNKIEKIKEQREFVYTSLLKCPQISKVYQSAANFLLVIAKDAEDLYQDLKSKGIIVRNRTKVIRNALRISIGSPEDNNLLLAALGVLTINEKASIRHSYQSRQTQETDIACEVRLDNKGLADINTGIPFFDHMLEQLAKHSGISITIKAMGDIDVDAHHTVEDVAIVLGQALKAALGNKRGINRYGFLLPMDESEAKVSIDLSGRDYCCFNGEFKRAQIGDFPTEMVKHFFESLSSNLGATIHIAVTGHNTHHMIEAIFKCTAKALAKAIIVSGDDLPSTKGVL